MTSHTFRKFFMSQMKLVVPIEMVEFLAGHAGYLSKEYRRYPCEQARSQYIKAEYIVSIHTPENIQEIQTKERDIQDQMNYVISELIRAQQERGSLKTALPVINERFS